jgi:hypothetical protein
MRKTGRRSKEDKKIDDLDSFRFEAFQSPDLLEQ